MISSSRVLFSCWVWLLACGLWLAVHLHALQRWEIFPPGSMYASVAFCFRVWACMQGTDGDGIVIHSTDSCSLKTCCTTLSHLRHVLVAIASNLRAAAVVVAHSSRQNFMLTGRGYDCRTSIPGVLGRQSVFCDTDVGIAPNLVLNRTPQRCSEHTVLMC